jgi:predicted ATPase/DNA-binding winged helix-turn-helix (wHTH) protein
VDSCSGPPAHDVISFGPFRLFAAERLLKKADEPVQVGSRALDILITLVERAGEVVTHKQLISQVWRDVIVEESSLRVHIGGLRKALGEGHEGVRYVVNVSGRGYCFVAPVTRSAAQEFVAPAEVTFTGRPQNLPARLTRMVGRDHAVRALQAQLMTWRFVSIVGPGGMGKTTVAVAVAHSVLNDFNGAAFCVDLSALTDPRLVPSAVASALGFTLAGRDPLVSLLASIGGKKILLVLDNCEHVIEAAAILAERAINEAPQAYVLATSREALRAEGEHIHLLYALDSPPEDASLTAAEALRYPAAQLFMERAAASGYSSGLSDADAAIVARICRRLDGIALAIELAASRTGAHGIRGIAELIDNRFKLVCQGRRTALPRHQTLNAMLDWSYNLLADREKMVLCRLSVFAGHFTLKAACCVALETEAQDEDATDAVANLVAKSLLSMALIDGLPYYRMLDTTRAYAASKLAGRGEADRTARRHAMFYSRVLQGDGAVQSIFGEHDLSGYAPHIGNVRAALEWAFSDGGDAAVGVDLAASAAPLLSGLSLLEECRRWCEQALGALDEASRGTRQEMILQAALAASSLYSGGHLGQVRTAIERGLSLAEGLEDRLYQMQLLAGLNLLLIRFGDLRPALALADQARVLAKDTKNAAGLTMADFMLARSHYVLGNQAAAQSHGENALTHAAKLGRVDAKLLGYDHRIALLALLARTLWLRGLSDQALRFAQKAIDEAANQDPLSVCLSLAHATPVFLWTGDLGKAGGLIERLIAYAGRHSLEPYYAAGTGLKGEFAIASDEADAGLDLLRNALETLRAKNQHVWTTVFTGALADGLRQTGQFEEALLTIDEEIARAKECGAAFFLADLLRVKAQILASMPRQDRGLAMNCLTEALAVAREQSALALELRSAMALARLLSESGQRHQGRHALAAVYGRFTEGFETTDLQTARRLIKDLT